MVDLARGSVDADDDVVDPFMLLLLLDARNLADMTNDEAIAVVVIVVVGGVLIVVVDDFVNGEPLCTGLADDLYTTGLVLDDEADDNVSM